jgi:CheY-like chemotaxis protein
VAIVKRNVRVGRPVSQCKLTGDNRLILCVDLQHSRVVKILNAQTQESLGGFKIEPQIKSPFDLVVASRFLFAYNRAESAIEQYKLDSGEKIRNFDISASHTELSAFVVSENAERFAMSDKRGVFTFWSIDGFQPLDRAEGFEPISLIEISENGDRAAIALKNGDILIARTDDLNNRLPLQLHRSGITALKFAANYLIGGDIDGRVTVWNAENGKLLRVYPLGGGAIRCIERAFDDRAAIATTDGGALALADINRDQKPLALDALSEGLTLVTFDRKTGLAVVVTSSWNLLFFDLYADKAIETFLTPPNGGANSKRGAAIKVIVADDSVTMRRMIAAALRASFPSLEILEAGDGKEAIETLEKNPDAKIMFMDWNMPTMDGETAVRKIKEAKIYPNLQIIMATTESGQEKVKQMLRMGVAGYLVKPFRRDAITKIAVKLIERIGK